MNMKKNFILISILTLFLSITAFSEEINFNDPLSLASGVDVKGGIGGVGYSITVTISEEVLKETEIEELYLYSKNYQTTISGAKIKDQKFIFSEVIAGDWEISITEKK